MTESANAKKVLGLKASLDSAGTVTDTYLKKVVNLEGEARTASQRYEQLFSNYQLVQGELCEAQGNVTELE